MIIREENLRECVIQKTCSSDKVWNWHYLESFGDPDLIFSRVVQSFTHRAYSRDKTSDSTSVLTGTRKMPPLNNNHSITMKLMSVTLRSKLLKASYDHLCSILDSNSMKNHRATRESSSEWKQSSSHTIQLRAWIIMTNYRSLMQFKSTMFPTWTSDNRTIWQAHADIAEFCASFVICIWRWLTNIYRTRSTLNIGF